MNTIVTIYDHDYKKLRKITTEMWWHWLRPPKFVVIDGEDYFTVNFPLGELKCYPMSRWSGAPPRGVPHTIQESS